MSTPLILLFSVAVLCSIGIFFGYIGGLSRTFKQAPATSINASNIKSQQEESIAQTEERRQKMMDDMKQRISDGYKKY